MSSTTSLAHRIFFFFLAVLFLFTAVGFSGFVIWQEHQRDKQATTSVDQNKLEGTKLKNFTPVDNIAELSTVDLKMGTGDTVTSPKQTVTVDYTGAVAATGVVFQSSLDTGQTVKFGLDQVIPGWTKGVIGMRVGGERRLLIPAVDAYGANPPQGSGIPTNADLVFNIVLHSIDS